jgi:hypothetical protein
MVAALDLAYLSWADRLGALIPSPIPSGSLGLLLFGVINTYALLSLAAPGGNRALAGARRAADAALVRLGPVAALSGLLAAALVLRLLVIEAEPLDPARADMLALMSRAMDRLLAGENPYVVHRLPYPMPLTYLPALWVPMTPAHWFGLDLRLVQAAVACAVGAVIASARWGGGGALGNSVSVRLGLGAAFLLCPATLAFVAIGHTALYWFYLVGLLAALAGGRWFLAGLCAGLCAAARQTMWPALLPVALLAWRGPGPPGRWRFCLGAAVALGGGAAFIAAAPAFALWDNLRWYAALDPWADPARRWWILANPGLGSVLYPLGLPGLVAPVGLAALALALAHAWRNVTDAATAIRAVGLALLAVTLAVPAPFRYEFIPVALVVIAAALTTTVTGRAPAPTGSADRLVVATI